MTYALSEESRPTASGGVFRAIPGRGSATAWILLALFLLVQYGLFRSYATREIAWVHPTDFDQSTYLLQSYENFERCLKEGLLSGAWTALTSPTPNGVLLPVQASSLYLLLGAGRLSALTLLFLYLALAEIAVFWVARWLSRSWMAAVLTLGLFLLSQSRFLVTGGIFDFRIDSVAASLYTIVLCLALRSELFRSRPLSVLCGAAAGLLILFRFVASAYTGPLLGLSCVLFAAMTYRTGVLNQREMYRVRAVNAAWSLAAAAIVAGPLLLWNAGVFLTYYGRHLGAERQIRQVEYGLTSAFEHLVFYPKSIFEAHLGSLFLTVAAVLVGLAWLVQSRSGPSHTQAGSNADLWRESTWFLLASILIPLIVLTADVSKSPVVGGVVVGPAALLVLILILRAGQQTFLESPVLRYASIAMAGVVFIHEFAAVSRHSAAAIDRTSEQELLDVYEDMASYAKDAGWSRVVLAVDRMVDYLTAQDLSIVHYERTGELLNVVSTLGGSIDAVPHPQAFGAVAKAGFAVLTTFRPADATALYPFDREMLSIDPELLARANKTLVPIRTLRYHGHSFTVFARPAISVEGLSGNWITASGVTLRMPCKLIAGKRSLTASGQTIFTEQIGNALHATGRLLQAGSSTPINVDVSPFDAKYSLKSSFESVRVANSGTCDLSLTFDKYFVPKERGINPDTRKLVIQAPTEFRFD